MEAICISKICIHHAAWCHDPEDYSMILKYQCLVLYLFQAERETQAFLKSSINKYYAAKEKDAVTLMWDYIMASVCKSKFSYHWPLMKEYYPWLVFLNTLNLCSFLTVRQPLSHSHKTSETVVR